MSEKKRGAWRRGARERGATGRGATGRPTGTTTEDSGSDSTPQLNYDSGTLTHSTDNSNKCLAILVTSVNIGDEVVMKEEAKDSLQVALQTDELSIETRYSIPLVGNQAGLEQASSTRAFVELKQHANSLGQKVSQLELNNASLEARVRVLTRSQEHYLCVRHRFISTFKRDKCGGEQSESDRQYIQQGNLQVHEGDVVTDSLLYTEATRARHDLNTFKYLYGIYPVFIAQLRQQATINLLNLHATARAARTQQCHNHFFTLFQEFIRKLQDQEGNYRDDYLIGPPTSVTQAYLACLLCYDSVAGQDGSCH
ncbi:unnamed protein product [Tuber aestivum]|uniref:Uncharacterized protein n=1 Tax=Tuber aestivum TaxID=59557 RepID=A0A292Q8Y6_9PEZI|nr:unnamed protein product [Tuber aestivum]